jgi:alkylhydroperoxidase family enzyme
VRGAEARRQGLTEEHIAEVRTNGGNLLQEHEQAVLLYAHLLLSAPDGVTDALLDELRRWYTDGQIVEMSFYVLTMNIGARFNTAIDLDEKVPGELALI